MTPAHLFHYIVQAFVLFSVVLSKKVFESQWNLLLWCSVIPPSCFILSSKTMVWYVKEKLFSFISISFYGLYTCTNKYNRFIQGEIIYFYVQVLQRSLDGQEVRQKAINPFRSMRRLRSASREITSDMISSLRSNSNYSQRRLVKPQQTSYRNFLDGNLTTGKTTASFSESLRTNKQIESMYLDVWLFDDGFGCQWAAVGTMPGWSCSSKATGFRCETVMGHFFFFLFLKYLKIAQCWMFPVFSSVVQV